MARVGIVQLAARFGDVAGQWSRTKELLDEAGPLDLALLSETALTGYVSPSGSFDLTALAEPVDGPTVAMLRETARALRTAIVAPLVERAPEGLFNALILIDAEGQLAGRYRKRHPWYPERWATPGNEPHPPWDVAGLRLMPAICFDVHFLIDEASPTLRSSDLVLFASAWVDDSPKDGRAPLLRALARHSGAPVANANWGPGLPRVTGQGGSRLVSGGGRTTMLDIDEGLLVVDVAPRPRV